MKNLLNFISVATCHRKYEYALKITQLTTDWLVSLVTSYLYLMATFQNTLHYLYVFILIIISLGKCHY